MGVGAGMGSGSDCKLGAGITNGFGKELELPTGGGGEMVPPGRKRAVREWGRPGGNEMSTRSQNSVNCDIYVRWLVK